MFSADQIKSCGCSQYDLSHWIYIIVQPPTCGCQEFAAGTWRRSASAKFQTPHFACQMSLILRLCPWLIDIDSAQPDHYMQSQAHLQGETPYLPALDALGIKLVDQASSFGFHGLRLLCTSSQHQCLWFLSFFHVPLGHLTNLSLMTGRSISPSTLLCWGSIWVQAILCIPMRSVSSLYTQSLLSICLNSAPFDLFKTFKKKHNHASAALSSWTIVRTSSQVPQLHQGYHRIEDLPLNILYEALQQSKILKAWQAH